MYTCQCEVPQIGQSNGVLYIKEVSAFWRCPLKEVSLYSLTLLQYQQDDKGHLNIHRLEESKAKQTRVIEFVYYAYFKIIIAYIPTVHTQGQTGVLGEGLFRNYYVSEAMTCFKGFKGTHYL